LLPGHVRTHRCRAPGGRRRWRTRDDAALARGPARAQPPESQRCVRRRLLRAQPRDAARERAAAGVPRPHPGRVRMPRAPGCRLPQALTDAFPGLESSAQRALAFVRSTPGITTALVGMGSRAHVAENLVLARTAPRPAGVDALFTRA